MTHQMVQIQMKYLAYVMVVTVLVLQGGCKLEVVNLASLVGDVLDPELLDIPYSVANFGFAPFGKTMVAKLFESPGLNLECNDTNPHEDNGEIQHSFLMIPRGECPFVTKAIHAQELGARMAIIIDNEEHQGKIIMKDNGYGYKVNIPAIFINYQHGNKLVKLLEGSNSEVVLKISFDNVKTDKVDVKFYLQIHNRMSYYLVQSFVQYFMKIQNYIDFSIVYDVIECPRCAENDCYCGKKYCSVHYEHGQSANGKMVLDQQLREIMFLKVYPNFWWSYMKCIDLECLRISELEECSKRCIKLQSINATDFQNKVSQTFQYGQSNNVLSEQLKLIQVSGVSKFPTVYLNNRKMKGSIQAQFIFDDICNTLISPPGSCSTYIQETFQEQSEIKNYWWLILIVIILSAIVFALMFVFCKRWTRKRMTQQMNGRVDDMVSKYIEFYSQRSNTK